VDVDKRFYAALILVAHGDTSRSEGLETVTSITERIPSYAARAAPALSRIDSTTIERARCADVGTPAADFRRPGGDARLQTLLRRGCTSALDWLVEQLLSEAPAGRLVLDIGPISAPLGAPIFAGDQAALVVSNWRGGAPYRMMRPVEERRSERAELAAWLREQFTRIQRGDTVEFAH
jgi:hypothetical protein